MQCFGLEIIDDQLPEAEESFIVLLTPSYDTDVEILTPQLLVQLTKNDCKYITVVFIFHHCLVLLLLYSTIFIYQRKQVLFPILVN